MLENYYYILIAIVTITIFIYIVYILVDKSRSTSKVLTTVINAESTHTISTDIINKLNNKIPMSNYAVSVWYYVKSWTNTNGIKKLIIRSPNVFELSLGSSTNILYVKMFGEGAPPDAPELTDDTISGANSGTSDPFATLNVDNLNVNSVHQYNSKYIFVFNKPASGRQLRVAMCISPQNKANPVTATNLNSGGAYNSFLLYDASGHTPNNIDSPVNTLVCSGSTWMPSIMNQTSSACASGTTPRDPPVITYISSHSSSSSNKMALIYNITNQSGSEYFSNSSIKQNFTFITDAEPSPIYAHSEMQQYTPPASSFVSYDMAEYNIPRSLYSQSSLLPSFDSKEIAQTLTNKNILEPFWVNVNNMPLQTWTNVILNVIGKSLTVYINGQIQAAYILPYMPTRMNNQIDVTPSPSFTGYTSGVRYIPKGISAIDAHTIYTSGYLGNGTIANLGSLFNRYSVQFKVLFKDRLAKS